MSHLGRKGLVWEFIVFPRVALPQGGAERSQRNSSLSNDGSWHESSDGRPHRYGHHRR